ncbi:MAG: 8-amino-7-oxononanoate synthase [Phycisphaerae bacterium]|nr:8-amino-7-oxononanoate synthase [Phycisphaerae bacterium]
MQKRLDALAAEGLLREPVELESAVGRMVRVGGAELVCMCSNDYLALANDPEVRAAAVEGITRWGVGAGASRLVSGTMSPHVELEQQLAAFKGTEAAVVAATGWMANNVAITALAGAGDLILCDKLNHASILDAAGACGAQLRTYHHCDVGRLRVQLEKYRGKYKRTLIVTDSLFSMDGDFAPLREIVELKQQYDAQLLIDEAHATGVFGAGGHGVAEALGVEQHIDATVGTLSKALGTLGGFVAGPKVLIDLIRNTGRAYIYTTAPPPGICCAAIKSLEIIRTQPQRREKLLQMAADLRDKLSAAGFDICGSQSQIVPVVVGEAAAAVEMSKRLLAEGFLIPAIRPPTVPRGKARLRISVTAAHTPADISRICELLRTFS